MNNSKVIDVPISTASLDKILEALTRKPRFVICLDGFVGVGKSTLARALAKKLDA